MTEEFANDHGFLRGPGSVRVAGFLIAAGPLLPIGLAAAIPTADPPDAPLGQFAAAIVAGIVVTLGGFVLPFRPKWGRTYATAGLLLWSALLIPGIGRSPALALGATVAMTFTLFSMWRGNAVVLPRTAEGGGMASVLAALTKSAAPAALAFWAFFSLTGLARTSFDEAAIGSAFLLAGTPAFLGALRARRWKLLRLPSAMIMVAAVGALAAGRDVPSRLVFGAVFPAAALLLAVRGHSDEERGGVRDWWEPFLSNPVRLLVSTFFVLCVAGSAVLALPASSATGRSIGALDAMFTAVSAVCVTGLIVRDTPVDFSIFGQGVILALIQLGGLGIMTFSTAAIAALGRRLSVRHEGAVAGLLSNQHRGDLFAATRSILLVTAVAEGLGFLLLAGLFAAHGDPAGAALWRGLFTSVSAFCNAGFSLQSDSLIGFNSSPAIVYTVAALIVVGGISPVTMAAIPRLARRGQATLQTKIILAATGVLLAAGLMVILTLEWHHALRGFSVPDRIHNAVFQSVTPRTAGFNTLDLTEFRPLTLTLLMILMAIGGSPGGTAGGIKTTTAAVMFFVVAAALRGRTEASAFGRRIAPQAVFRTAAVAMFGLLAVVAAFFALRLTQDIPPMTALFEVISALGTVGLSIGGTARLDGLGKWIIAGCMFAGRVGPLTLALLLAGNRSAPLWQRPEEDVQTG